jgi:hypothetical protein
MMTYFKQTLAAAGLLLFLSGTTIASASETESSAATTAATSTLTLRQGALLKTPTAKELPKKVLLRQRRRNCLSGRRRQRDLCDCLLGRL